MLSLNEGFIGCKPDSILYFSGQDSEDLYTAHLKSMPLDWYYRNNILSYRYNSLGHRSKNIDEIDLENYILFVGCSHTEGIGHILEDTYPYKVASLLNCDYYNLGIGGCGIDIMLHNLSMWLLNIPQKPKAIVWQWTDPVRYLTVNEVSDPYVVSHGIWEQNKTNQDFIIAGESSNFFRGRTFIVAEYLKSIENRISVIQVSFQEKYATNKIFYQCADRARDNGHYGRESNKILAEKIVDKYNYELNNNRISGS